MAMAMGVAVRQEFDIPDPRLEATEHQVHINKCSHCCKETKADFPEGVTCGVQYGPRVKAAVYLKAQQLLRPRWIANLKPNGGRERI